MPRIPRKYLDTNIVHIMSQGINRSYIFENPVDIKFYIKSMYEIKDKYNVKIIAYCIMNNHTHILLKTESIKNLSKYMQSLNTRYGHYYNKKYKRVGYVFRDRYRAQGIYNEIQLNKCIKYIYDNPVKAGICTKPEQYKFSNYKEVQIETRICKGEEELIFIDIDDNKEEICKNIVDNYLKKNKIKKSNLENNELEELIYLLKEKYNISFRMISKIININREKISKIYKNIV